MDKLDFLSPFYQQEHDRESFVQGLSSVLASEPCEVRIMPFALKNVELSRFPFSLRDNKDITMIKKSNGVTLFRLKSTIQEHKERKQLVGKFFVFEHPLYERVGIVFTLEDSRFWNKGLKPLVTTSYPKISLTHIPHDFMRRLLEDFQQHSQISELVIKRAYFRLRMGKDDKKGKSVPFASWPERSLDKVFDWVYEKDGWFKSIEFDALIDSQRIATISFARDGGLKTNGLFKSVFDNIVLRICDNIQKNITLFKNRSRWENVGLKVRPLVIDFGMNIFKDDYENEKFIETMKGLSSSSVSVQHGNPYIHLSVLDYYDGSAFDLWVLSDKQLYIVPQMKGTITSIKRLINHVFDNFSEGEVFDYEDVK